MERHNIWLYILQTQTIYLVFLRVHFLYWRRHFQIYLKSVDLVNVTNDEFLILILSSISCWCYKWWKTPNKQASYACPYQQLGKRDAREKTVTSNTRISNFKKFNLESCWGGGVGCRGVGCVCRGCGVGWGGWSWL